MLESYDFQRLSPFTSYVLVRPQVEFAGARVQTRTLWPAAMRYADGHAEDIGT